MDTHISRDKDSSKMSQKTNNNQHPMQPNRQPSTRVSFTDLMGSVTAQEQISNESSPLSNNRILLRRKDTLQSSLKQSTAALNTPSERTTGTHNSPTQQSTPINSPKNNNNNNNNNKDINLFPKGSLSKKDTNLSTQQAATIQSKSQSQSRRDTGRFSSFLDEKLLEKEAEQQEMREFASQILLEQQLSSNQQIPQQQQQLTSMQQIQQQSPHSFTSRMKAFVNGALQYRKGIQNTATASPTGTTNTEGTTRNTSSNMNRNNGSQSNLSSPRKIGQQENARSGNKDRSVISAGVSTGIGIGINSGVISQTKLSKQVLADLMTFNALDVNEESKRELERRKKEAEQQMILDDHLISEEIRQIRLDNLKHREIADRVSMIIAKTKGTQKKSNSVNFNTAQQVNSNEEHFEKSLAVFKHLPTFIETKAYLSKLAVQQQMLVNQRGQNNNRLAQRFQRLSQHSQNFQLGREGEDKRKSQMSEGKEVGAEAGNEDIEESDKPYWFYTAKQALEKSQNYLTNRKERSPPSSVLQRQNSNSNGLNSLATLLMPQPEDTNTLIEQELKKDLSFSGNGNTSNSKTDRIEQNDKMLSELNAISRKKKKKQSSSEWALLKFREQANNAKSLLLSTSQQILKKKYDESAEAMKEAYRQRAREIRKQSKQIEQLEDRVISSLNRTRRGEIKRRIGAGGVGSGSVDSSLAIDESGMASTFQQQQQQQQQDESPPVSPLLKQFKLTVQQTPREKLNGNINQDDNLSQISIAAMSPFAKTNSYFSATATAHLTGAANEKESNVQMPKLLLNKEKTSRFFVESLASIPSEIDMLQQQQKLRQKDHSNNGRIKQDNGERSRVILSNSKLAGKQQVSGVIRHTSLSNLGIKEGKNRRTTDEQSNGIQLKSHRAERRSNSMADLSDNDVLKWKQRQLISQLPNPNAGSRSNSNDGKDGQFSGTRQQEQQQLESIISKISNYKNEYKDDRKKITKSIKKLHYDVISKEQEYSSRPLATLRAFFPLALK